MSERGHNYFFGGFKGKYFEKATKDKQASEKEDKKQNERQNK